MAREGFYLRGLLFEKPTEPKSTRTVAVNSDETDHLIKRLTGLPVCVEHDRNCSVGQVLDCMVNFNGDILADVFIDTTREEGRVVKERIKSGELKSLSFSSLFGKAENGLRWTSHYPIEVSIVQEGAIDRSRIFVWSESPFEMTISKSGFSQVYQLAPSTQTISDPVETLKMNDLSSDMTSPQSQPTSDSQVQASSQLQSSPPPARSPDANQKQAFEQITGIIHRLGITPENVHEFQQKLDQLDAMNTKDVKQFLFGTNGQDGFVDFAGTLLTPTEMQGLENELVRNIEKLPYLCRVAASLNTNYVSLKAQGEKAQAELEQLQKQKQEATRSCVMPEERRVSRTPYEQNQQIIREAFVRKRPAYAPDTAQTSSQAMPTSNTGLMVDSSSQKWSNNNNNAQMVESAFSSKRMKAPPNPVLSSDTRDAIEQVLNGPNPTVTVDFKNPSQ